MAEKVAFAVVTSALAALAAVLVTLVSQAAAPEPQIGPEGRVPAWLEDERASDRVSASRSAAAG